MKSYNNGIYLLDAHYLRDNLAAVYMLVEGDSVALVETANAASLQYVLDALGELNLTPEAVKYILLTHIHLDHAGGAGSYMAAFPNAQLVVHPKGVRHMIDPSYLEAGVVGVYGQEFVDKVYGKLAPIAASRIIKAEDGLIINLNGRELICRDTPGHANHHNIIVDSKSSGIFSGDIFGVAYPELILAGKNFVFPTTTPVNFSPEKMLQSIDLIESLAPEAVYLTHFGQISDIQQVANDLRRMIADYVAIACESAGASDVVAEITRKLEEYIVREAQGFGIDLSPERILELIGVDMQINAQGLAVWLRQTSSSRICFNRVLH
ncbi:MAG: MBL fold metallo-hydrolase [Burkholderiales bacterium]|nr:MBL fold metallo-hydrolase [Burkholderiales bacterium]